MGVVISLWPLELEDTSPLYTAVTDPPESTKQGLSREHCFTVQEAGKSKVERERAPDGGLTYVSARE